MADVPVTQRAYTLRLRGVEKNDNSWRDKLWKTHEAVNKGAKAFGDWLLTLRGGLDHSLADEPALTEADINKEWEALKKDAKKKKTEEPGKDTAKEIAESRRNGRIRDKRILLALSWLSVESEKGAPSNYFVQNDLDTKTGRRSNWKTVDALKDILKSRGLNNGEIDQWVNDCSASLSAAIRDDAVWVNRSKAFDEVCNGQDISKARKDAQALLCFLLTDDYLQLPKKAKKKDTSDSKEDEPSEEELEEEKQSAAIQSGKGAGQRTRHPFSHIFGFKEDSEGFGKGKAKLDLKDFWKEHLKPCIADSGIPLSDTKQKRKGEASPTELQREMFSKATSRLAQIHTKQKQQEVEREQRKAADEELNKLERDDAYKDAISKIKGYCERYEGSSGSLREFQIQPRQITKWEAVVEAWSKITETDTDKAEEKRKEEAKRLQEELRDDKFGDINLFIRLSEEEYKPVWWHSDKADASILKTFVKGMKARADAEFLKVAAYRHPDPYFNPVFCQFGVSRPAIKFNRLDPSPSEDVRTVKMLTWNGQKADKYSYLAVSKHFDDDIGSICESTHEGATKPRVSRRDRLNLSAVGSDKENVCVAHVFDQKEVKKRKKDDESENETVENAQKEPEWNGTLQADRWDLKNIGDSIQTDKTKAENLLKKLNWSLIVSMELQPSGPYYDYIEDAKDKSPFERTVRKDEEKGQKRKKGTKYISYIGWPHEEVNKPLKEKEKRKDDESPSLVVDTKNERQGHAKLILSRLPGLRVLSVDLGHRYAAACAVFETLTCEKFEEECKEAKGKGAEVIVNDLYAMIQHPEKESNAITKKARGENRIKRFKPTTFYRRIGADTLNNTSHPAPWARLDRQFLIKLQGEEEAARKASSAEIEAFCKLEQELGRSALKDRSFQVDELMSDAVRMVRLGLKRHADRARIAHYLITDKKVKPGGVEENLDDNGRIEMLTTALELWHGLATSNQWEDKWAEDLWNQQTWKGDVPLTKRDIEDKTRQQFKKEKEDLRNKLKPVAEKLAKQDNMKLHCLWATRWREDDANWKKRLRRLRDWILPFGESAKSPAIRHVGGLSLTRIATIKSLYQVQKAYHMRPEPDNLRKNIPDKGDDSMRGFGKSILDAMEHMREQRVKQLASRIVEAALGVGRIKIPKKGKDPKRPCEQVDAPCHAVVIENLTHYRPEETRTRRENRQLMTWSSSKVKKYLSEGCQLHGLHLREVQAGYTSRQDSRTGAPGIRCEDVPVKDFLESPFWKKEVKSAGSKDDARSKYLSALCEKASVMTDGEKKKTSLRIPRKGGDIFVSAEDSSPASKGIQADLNAAANIGLKALLDPDWPGRWWYVPCDSKEFKPVADKVKGSTAIDVNNPLKTVAAEGAFDGPAGNGKKKRGKQKGDGKSKDVVNLWRDVSSQVISTDGVVAWEVYFAYQNQVQYRVIEILKKQSKLNE